MASSDLAAASIAAGANMNSTLWTNAANEEMQQQQNKWNLEQWHRNNAYNHPAAQMQRLKAAGLNPDLLYGQNAAGAMGCDFAVVDLDVLGYVDPGVTIDIIKDGKLVEKKKVSLPKQLKNIIKCKNPRCITTTEQELPHIFKLTGTGENKVYRCIYCETKAE